MMSVSLILFWAQPQQHKKTGWIFLLIIHYIHHIGGFCTRCAGGWSELLRSDVSFLSVDSSTCESGRWPILKGGSMALKSILFLHHPQGLTLMLCTNTESGTRLTVPVGSHIDFIIISTSFSLWPTESLCKDKNKAFQQKWSSNIQCISFLMTSDIRVLMAARQDGSVENRGGHSDMTWRIRTEYSRYTASFPWLTCRQIKTVIPSSTPLACCNAEARRVRRD